ncbi:FACT complex subunit SPT16 [Russula aff. rugulosa BPL654]|nr:FACT complex subunit SPT16 [Russula aff. rugulosa BPL654]
MTEELNKELIYSRMKIIYDSWTKAGKNDEYSAIADVDGIFLAAGEDEPVRKGTAFQTWLLGYEFPSTFILFQKDKISILCSARKAKILEQLQKHRSVAPVEIFTLAKSKEPPTDALPQFLSAFTSNERIGHLAKETYAGKLIDEWDAALTASNKKPEMVDIAASISTFMAVKDDEELATANLTVTLLTHYVALKLETILDRETKISHEQFATQIEARLGSGEGETAKGPDTKVWSKGRGINDVDWLSTEFCYSPIIQSRSSADGYDLKPTAESSAEDMSHKGVFLVSLGMRYRGYCANLGRTFIVDPDKEQESVYNLLLNLQAEILQKMKDGAVARDLYQHALSYVKKHKPDLEKHFVKNIGFGMGMEFRDSTYLLSPKNTRQLKANMVFCLSLGFQDLEDQEHKRYALQINDSVKIGQDKGICITEGVKSAKDTLFYLTRDDSEEEKVRQKPPTKTNGNASPMKNKTAGGKVLRNKTRGAKQDEAQSTSAKIAEHQKELHDQLQEQGLARYSEEGDGANGKEGKSWKKFQSYKGEAGLPKEVETLRIFVDRKSQTVILPIHGFAVPFHIYTIKNVSKNDEGDFTYLRVNFQTPGQLAGKKEDTPFEDPDSTFIRSITYRSTDGHRFDTVSRQITDLKKEVNKREQQKKELADVIEQDVLVEMKGRRPHKLPEVFVRPAPDGKRLPGEVEIHQNGLRYHSPLGTQKTDVLFSNVRHLFFQPCDHELLVIIHVHLKAPIMIGKKKTYDVQFYREASDVQFDETGNRKRKYRYGDEDEIEMEQQERKRRQMLNKEFKSFSERIAEAAVNSTGDSLEPDIPFRELSFEGVPFRTNVRLQPTTDCLVHLSDPPFLVVTLADIEIASLERVQFGLKQFDLVLVFKDFTRAPLHINSIPSMQLDDVKNWLDSVDIPLAEGPVNLNWGPIMKTINDSPFDFFRGGGWTFLGGTGDDSEQEEETETESEFAAESLQASSETSSDAASEQDDFNASEDEGSESDFEESEGEDWDELERKAAKSDKKRAEGGHEKADDSDDSDRPKKKAPAKSKPQAKRAANGKGKR